MCDIRAVCLWLKRFHFKSFVFIAFIPYLISFVRLFLHFLYLFSFFSLHFFWSICMQIMEFIGPHYWSIICVLSFPRHAVLPKTRCYFECQCVFFASSSVISVFSSSQLSSIFSWLNFISVWETVTHNHTRSNQHSNFLKIDIIFEGFFFFSVSKLPFFWPNSHNGIGQFWFFLSRCCCVFFLFAIENDRREPIKVFPITIKRRRRTQIWMGKKCI